MGCGCSKEDLSQEKVGQSSDSGACRSGSSSQRKSRLWINRTGYRLAEIENRSSSTVVFMEKNRDVWVESLFNLEPEQRKQFPASTQLVDTAETFTRIEIMILASEGTVVRAAPPVFIEPLELVRCKQIIIRGHGSKLKLDKI